MSDLSYVEKQKLLGEFDVVSVYNSFLRDDPDLTKPIAAIEALVLMMKEKEPSTQLELIKLVDAALTVLSQTILNSVSLMAGCDLFARFVMRNMLLYSDWESCKRHLVENGQLFVLRLKEARKKIAGFGIDFIKDDDLLLVHGFSRAIFSLLEHAFAKHIRFRVIITESKPSSEGLRLHKLLVGKGIPAALILDSSVGYVINKVDKVLVGAEGVAESGGIINHIGTFQIALLAKNFNKPVYVAAESYKFVRLFPLSPDDLNTGASPLNFNKNCDPERALQEGSPKLDFTPHEYITALVTDLGVLTPSAVSEELIKIWYD